MKQPLNYIPDVVESHLDEIAFLYEQYLAEMETQQSNPDYLRQLTKRLKANINGVLLVSDVAWGEVESLLGEDEGAAFFTATVVAFGTRDVQRIKQTIDMANGEVAISAVAFALAWLPWKDVSNWAEKFIHSKRPALIFLGIYAYLWHRKKEVAEVVQDYERVFASDAPVAVINNVLTLIRTTQHRDMVSQLRDLSSAQEDSIGEPLFRILETRLLLGDETAIQALKGYLVEHNPRQESAAELCFSYLQTDAAKVWLRELQTNPGSERLMLIAIGALKEKALLPWVLNQMQNPELSRLAGKTLGQIVGADIEAQGWVLNDESLDEAWLEIEGDEMLPWPDVNQIRLALGMAKQIRN